MAMHPMDPSAMQTYTQNYLYDAVGNILQLQHIGATAGSYTRNYAYGSGNSKLNSTQIGATNYPYTYDSRGNMITMPHLSTMDWNGLNEMQHTDNGTVETYFNYSGGQRIRKVCVKAGGIEEHRIYLGSYEIYRKFVSSSLTQERLTVHVSDDMGRIAMVETETTPTPATRIRYIYSNHLQSATLELDDSCAIISYEEYHPFGTTAFQSSDAAINAVAKRYRYTGKERDEETGLYYHGARYYIPWICRWSASDPLESKYAGMSPYNYSMNNPVMMNDPSGAAPEGDGGNNYLNTIKANGPVEWMNEDGTIDSGIVGNKLNEVVIKPQPSEPSFFASLGFNENGYYRNEYSDGGLKSPGNYLRFLDNAAGSIWNGGVSVASSFKNLFTNFSFEGLSQELSGYYNYYFNNSISNLWNDTKTAFSDVRTYENITGVAMTMGASSISNSIVSLTNPETVTFYHGTSMELTTSIESGIDLSIGNPRADFGQGFYLTKNYGEALKSAERLYGAENASVIRFSVPIKKLNKLSSYQFNGTSSMWENFINFNKSGGQGVNNIGSYDMISGPMFGRISSAGKMLQYGNRTQTAIFTPKAVKIFNRYLQHGDF